MTVQEFLDSATATLKLAGVESARLDCFILLEDQLGMDRARLLTHPDSVISVPQITKLNKHIAQRAKHIPMAYIRGHAPFFGREFAVNQHVLVPRPETETMIEILKMLPLPDAPQIIDVGTGSGCIGITAALELPKAHIELYDINPKALNIAKQNARQLKVAIKAQPADLLDTKPEPTADVIMTNLPYVPENYQINQAARHEPRLAIFSGKDGLVLYRRFWTQVAGLDQKPRYVLTESLQNQHDAMIALAKDAGFQLRQSQDLIQVFERSA